MNGVSVIICCYNSSEKLPPTLAHLAEQILEPGINYEIILVDNNCTDDTQVIALETWQKLGNPFVLKIVKQLLPGLNYAREMGINMACYEYVVLCDDDNWLCFDYLLKIYRLFETILDIVLIGGVGEGVYEITPPEWFFKLNGFGYAIGDEGRKTGFVDSIYGAGMSLRKSIFQSLVKKPFALILSDRNGKELSSGGDTEISKLFSIAGYKIYLDTSLTFKHYFEKKRLGWGYYLKLRRSFGKANAYLQLYEKYLPNRSLEIDKNVFHQLLFVTFFSIRHFYYLLFPYLFKNEGCSNFNEKLMFFLTRLSKNRDLQNAAKQVQINFETLGIYRRFIR
jgi:glycosyltransferase involved in cell wall biosynthesis